MIDVVNRPAHYNKGRIECIDAIEVATSDLSGIEAVCTANAIKYLWRWKQKNGRLEESQMVHRAFVRKGGREMTEFLIFIIGAWIGAIVGVVTVALCVAASRRRNDG